VSINDAMRNLMQAASHNQPLDAESVRIVATEWERYSVKLDATEVGIFDAAFDAAYGADNVKDAVDTVKCIWDSATEGVNRQQIRD
jgi:hypothetical protein